MAEKRYIGLLAGEGSLPVEFAKRTQERGLSVLAIGLTPNVDPAVAQHAARYAAIPLTQWGTVVETLKEAGVETVYLLGSVSKRTLYANVALDARGIAILQSVKDRRDDALLLAVTADLEREGITIGSQVDLFPEILAEAGLLTRRPPTERERKDVAFAMRMAKAIAGLDIGQTVVVKEQAVLAVEAIDGTNETLRRGARLGNGDVVAAKVAKPRQDPRFDVPTVGPDTVRAMAECGVRVLAFEAGKTILLDKEVTVRLADEADLTLIAVEWGGEEGEPGCAS